jgi:DNA-binding CsgD family transcriptional regulator
MWLRPAVCALPIESVEPLGAKPTVESNRRASGLPAEPTRADTSGHEDGAGHRLGAPALPETLTSAERAVVAAVLRGCSYAEIARERGSSPHTVGNLLANAFRKLGVRSRGELAAKLVARNEAAPRALPAKLSDRERQAATLAALGHSNKHIAYDLGIAPSTVSKYLERAAIKLGVRSRVSLIQIMSALSGS